MTEQTEWEKLREKIAKRFRKAEQLTFKDFGVKDIQEWEELTPTAQAFYYSQASLVLADFKASFPALAKQEGYVKLAKDQEPPKNPGNMHIDSSMPDED